ncbi:MAG: M23 family metallopeptidase [Acidimicrobiia bacterium]
MGRRNYAVAATAVLTASVLFIGLGPHDRALASEPESDSPPTTVAADDDAGEAVMTPPNPVRRIDVERRLVFPVVGSTSYYGGFGACRDACTREHHGIDIMSWHWKGLPVVAAHDGVVTKVTYDSGNSGCSVHIRHTDRWQTRYLHLNNDLPGTDEIGAPCPAEGIRVGVTVKAGQLLGYVGDSGNAETTPPHLHFELRTPSGYPVDPYRSLRHADRVTYEWLPSDLSQATLTITDTYEPDPNSTTIIVPIDEAGKLTGREDEQFRLNAPVVVIDPDDPSPAIAEIDRLESHAVVIMADGDTRWIEYLLSGHAIIVESVPFPAFTRRDEMIHDEYGLKPLASSEPDRFSTIIAGRIDKIWRSRTEAFEAFATDHRSVVLVADRWARRNLGLRSGASPGRYADRDLLWWATGDGWIGTETALVAPDRGHAYVTERMATPWTLAFLGSLAEAEPVPRWKAR